MELFNKRLTGRLNPAFILLALFLGCSITGIARQQQPRSDYEIQQEFKKQYKEISNNLEEADSSAAVRELMEEVKKLEESYASHEELLNKALYPDTFEEEMRQLKKRVIASERQLAVIEQQEQKLQELSQKMTSYDSQLETLNNRTDSLQNAMQKSIKSERQLAALNRRYRENLEQRDDLILSFVDSVMITYQNLNIESMQDLENAQKKARFNSDGNALKMILTIAKENIALLESNSDLTTEEYLRMSSVQQEFQTMWNKVGDKLVNIYAEGDKEKARKSVSEAIATWSKKVASQAWASINSSFDKAGIQLPKFTDNETFYETLSSYLSESIESSKNDGSKEKLQNYRNFSSFWTNKVQTDWSPYMIDANVLSSRQMASIDQQLEQWAGNAEPRSNLLIYLLGISVLAIVALGVMLAREKRGKKA